MIERTYAPEWADERDRLARRGLLRRVGTHPNGEPKFVVTWKGRRAVAYTYACEFWDAVVEDPCTIWMVLAVGVVTLLSIVNAVGKSFGWAGL